MTERRGNFLKGRIAGTLAETEHAYACMRRAPTHSRKRIRRCQPEIVVAVEFELKIALGAELAEDIVGLEWIEHAERIRKAETMRAGLRRSIEHTLQKTQIGTA